MTDITHTIFGAYLAGEAPVLLSAINDLADSYESRFAVTPGTRWVVSPQTERTIRALMFHRGAALLDGINGIPVVVANVPHGQIYLCEIGACVLEAFGAGADD